MNSKKEKAIKLINELRSGAADDRQQEQIVAELDSLLPDPNYWDYTIDHSPELSAIEIVERAFRHKPINT